MIPLERDEKKLLEKFVEISSSCAEKLSSLNAEDNLYWRWYQGRNGEDYEEKHPNDIGLGDIFRIVQTAQSRMITDPRVNALKVFGADTSKQDANERINQALNYFAAKGKLDQEIRMMNINLLLTGRAYGFCDWEDRYQKIYRRGVNITRRGKKVRFDEDRILIHSIPRFTAIKNEDIWFDTNAERKDDIKWVIRKRMLSLADMKQANEDAKAEGSPLIYKNLDKLEREFFDYTKIKSDVWDDNWGSDKEWLSSLGITDNDDNIPYDDNVIVHEWYDLYNWRLVSIAYGLIVIRDTPIPFEHGCNPFIFATCGELPFSMFGVGIRPIEGLFRAKVATKNMHMEHMSIVTKPPIICGEPTIKNSDLQEIYRKNWIKITSRQKITDVISTLNLGNPLNAQTAVLTERDITEDIDRIMSSPKQAQGLSSAGEQTATEIKANEIGIESRIAMFMAAFQSEVTSEISLQFFYLMKENLRDDIEYTDIVSGTRQKLNFMDVQDFEVDVYSNPTWNWQQYHDPSGAAMLWTQCRTNPQLYNELELFDNMLVSMGYRKHERERFIAQSAQAAQRVIQKQVALAETTTDGQGIRAGIDANPAVIAAENQQEAAMNMMKNMPSMPPMPPTGGTNGTQG